MTPRLIPRLVPRLEVALAVTIVVVIVLVPASVVATGCWTPPVAAPVRDPFREPACPWCPGNRGIEYATTAGQVAVVAVTGRVTFAGSVAGTVYVVVEVGDGRYVTYGRLLDVSHEVGDIVVRGRPLGRVATSFHFGVRQGERYVDPAPLLGRLVARPRLVPLDGTSPAAAPPAVLQCRSDPDHRSSQRRERSSWR